MIEYLDVKIIVYVNACRGREHEELADIEVDSLSALSISVKQGFFNSFLSSLVLFSTVNIGTVQNNGHETWSHLLYIKSTWQTHYSKVFRIGTSVLDSSASIKSKYWLNIGVYIVSFTLNVEHVTTIISINFIFYVSKILYKGPKAIATPVKPIQSDGPRNADDLFAQIFTKIQHDKNTFIHFSTIKDTVSLRRQEEGSIFCEALTHGNFCVWCSNRTTISI